MSQSESAKFTGNWKALFICPNPKIARDLGPLLSRYLPAFSAQEINDYPTRQKMAEVLATQHISICFLEVSDAPEQGLAVIMELLRADPKLPIVVVLSSNDPEMVLRCLRQGASDFLMQPFTGEQVEAALQKISRLHPGRSKTPGKVYCLMPAKGGTIWRKYWR